MAEILSIDFRKLGTDLRNARRLPGGRRQNPRGLPPSIKEIYDDIGRKSSDHILLSVNPKVVKGMKSKYATGILHFASSNTARKAVQLDPKAWGLTKEQAKKVKNVCPQASKGCIATCLVGSGHGGLGSNIGQFKLNKVTQARVRRQLLLDTNAEGFFTVLILEIAKQAESWRKKGYRYVVRLNGTSDLDFENIPVTVPKDLAEYVARQYGMKIRAGKHRNIMSVFPKITFYDYTKVTRRYADWASGKMPPNYHLTFSLSEQPINRRIALEVLKNKVGNVAVPFNTPPTVRGKEHPLPKTLTIDGHTFPVYDADKDDLRFLDPRRHGKGKIAGLRFKLPTDPSRRAKIESTDFRIRSWPDPHPEISTKGGNVVKRNPKAPALHFLTPWDRRAGESARQERRVDAIFAGKYRRSEKADRTPRDYGRNPHSSSWKAHTHEGHRHHTKRVGNTLINISKADGSGWWVYLDEDGKNPRPVSEHRLLADAKRAGMRAVQGVRRNPRRHRRNPYRGPLGIKDPAVQGALRDAAEILDEGSRRNPPIPPDLIFDPHAPVPEKMSKRDRARLADLRRAYQASIETQKRVPLTTPETVAELLIPRIGSSKVESLYLLALDARSNLIDEPVMISRGDTDGTDAPVRGILRAALVSGASSFIVGHNHPSGGLEPSGADIVITRRLAAGGRAVDLPLMDHVIVTRRGHASLRRDRPDAFQG